MSSMRLGAPVLSLLSLLSLLSAASVEASPGRDRLAPEPPAAYLEALEPHLLDAHQVLAVARTVEQRAAAGEDGAVVLTETLTRIDDDGAIVTVEHDVWRANTQGGVEGVARAVLPFRLGEERLHVVRARTLLPDGEVVAVRPEAIFVQTPQERADDALYTDLAELVILFPRVEPGSAVEYVVTREEEGFRIPGHFTGQQVFQTYWPTDTLRYLLDVPASIATRLRITRIGDQTPEPVRSPSAPGRELLEWRRDGIPSFEPAPWAPPLSETGPAVWLSTLASWDDLAGWFRGLVSDRGELSTELRDLVAATVDRERDPRRIVAELHRRVADEIRYTGLEFGIAGYQPRRPTDVWDDRLGDCKDKANLLRVLLAEAGIPSWIGLVDTTHAGRIEERSPDFRHFDHAILAIAPDPEDETLVWADPTVERLPAGLLTSRTSSRPVVLVGDDGARLVETPPGVSDRLESLLELSPVGKRGVTGWWTVSVEGPGSSAWQAHFDREELAERRGLVQEFLGGAFPDAEIFDVDVTSRPGAFEMKSYLEHRPEGGSEGRALRFPELWSRHSAEVLATTGRGDLHQRLQEVEARVVYELPGGVGVPEGVLPRPLSSSTPALRVAAGWTCAPEKCTAAVQYHQRRSLADAAEVARMATVVRELDAWMERSSTVVLAPGASESHASHGPPPAGRADLPVLSTAEAQLDLALRRFPAAVDAQGRREALSRVVEWFPGPEHRESRFEARVWRADLGCDAGDPAGEDAIREQLSNVEGVGVETIAWARFLLGLCSTVGDDESEAIFTELAGDPGLSVFRRGWSAWQLAWLLDARGAREEALAVVQAAPATTDVQLADQLAVQEVWLLAGGSSEDLAARLASILEGDVAPSLLEAMAAAVESWPGDRGAHVLAALSDLALGTEGPPAWAERLAELGWDVTASARRSELASRLDGLFRENPPEWWDRVPAPEATADVGRLVARVDELAQTPRAAEYLRHAAHLLVEAPNLPDFGERLWLLAAVFAENFAEEPVVEPLIDILADLPVDDPYRVEAVFLRGACLERAAGPEAALEYYRASAANEPEGSGHRVDLAYRRGLVLERMGRAGEALATYAEISSGDAWVRSSDARLREVLLHLEAGRDDRALEGAASLAAESPETIERMDDSMQARSLAKLAERPETARAYWSAGREWFEGWAGVARGLGLEPGEDLRLPALGDVRETGLALGERIRAGDLLGSVDAADLLLRAARWHPELLVDAASLLVRVGQNAPERGVEIRDVALEMLAAAPAPGDDPELLDTWRKAALVRSGHLIDAERVAEAASIVRSLLESDLPEGDLRRRAVLMQALVALANGQERESAAEQLEIALVPEWSDPTRGLAVLKLAELLRVLDRTEDEAALLDRELESGALGSGLHALVLQDRREELASGAVGSEVQIAALEAFLAEADFGWLDIVRPYDAHEDPWPSRSVEDWLEDDDVSAPSRLKLAVLVAGDEATSPSIRAAALGQLPYLVALNDGWNTLRGFETLGLLRSSDGWSEEVRWDAVFWQAIAATTPELQARVVDTPEWDSQPEWQRDYLEERWAQSRLLDASPEEIRARLAGLTVRTLLDEDEFDFLERALRRLQTKEDLDRGEEHLGMLDEVRVDGDEHAVARVRFALERQLRILREHEPMVGALRSVLLGDGPPPAEPDDWWEIQGADPTVAALPPDRAAAHLLYALVESAHVDPSGVQLFFDAWFRRGVGPGEWETRTREALRVALQGLESDGDRADLLYVATWPARRDRTRLEDLRELASPWARDATAPETRAALRHLERILDSLAGREIRWTEELARHVERPRIRYSLSSLRIRALVGGGDAERLDDLLEATDFEDLVDPDRIDDHLLAVRAAGRDDLAPLVEEVARREIDEALVESWIELDWRMARWALDLAELLGAPEAIPSGWVAAMRRDVKNPAMLAELDLRLARLSEDWVAVGEAARRWRTSSPGNVDLAWDLARSAAAAGDREEALRWVEEFLEGAQDHWQTGEARAMRTRLMGPAAPEAAGAEGS